MPKSANWRFPRGAVTTGHFPRAGAKRGRRGSGRAGAELMDGRWGAPLGGHVVDFQKYEQFLRLPDEAPKRPLKVLRVRCWAHV